MYIRDIIHCSKEYPEGIFAEKYFLIQLIEQSLVDFSRMDQNQ